jgi:dTDP-glucose pyrophosphorylase/CBS domain-containing protein
MWVDINTLSIPLACSIRQSIISIDRGARGIVLVVDSDRYLLGTITDGDVRRAILDGVDLESSVQIILARKAKSLDIKPITAPLDSEREMLLQLMKKHVVRQLPLLDGDGRVIDLVTMEDLLPPQPLHLQAVIMAGGQGTRLRPLTENLPKPMLPVNGQPVMESIIYQLRDAGIRHVNVTTHYKPEKIIEYFGDGQAFGIQLSYVNEDRPLGTGGALGLMTPPNEPMLVINGDILTQVDFGAMLAFHQENHADMTIAVRNYEVQVPYGVIECEGSRVRQLREKPQLGFLVNAGIYLLEPIVFQYMPQGKYFNITDLIQWLLDANRTVISFPIHEYWLDIGQHADYIKAQDDVGNRRMKP